MAIDKKVLKSSIEREQNELARSAEREKIKGLKNLNVPFEISGVYGGMG